MADRFLHKGKLIQDELQRLAGEIVSGDGASPVLVGIHTNGVPIARRLGHAIASAGHAEPAIGAIDITLYRDDLAGKALPQVHGSDIPIDLEGRRVVLVDDVLFTGRTIRAALAVLTDFGRPERIELCVLVDRGHRELPICPDFVGLTIKTERTDHVAVTLTESGAGEDAVVLRN
ncbi:MAG: bifunctional pyr operon transcriptional regulator/uracil phosphoribosyltransferase PyrR [Planctomycetota bacterium]